jgi:hypothetical protein
LATLLQHYGLENPLLCNFFGNAFAEVSTDRLLVCLENPLLSNFFGNALAEVSTDR